MKKNALRLISFLALLLSFGAVVSCSSDDESAAPTIKLIEGDNLVSADCSVPVGSTLNFRVSYAWNGEDVLTNFIVEDNGTRVIDEGINQRELTRDVSIVFTSETMTVITFTIRDIKGKSSSVSVKVESNGTVVGGKLLRFSNLTLYAQEVQGGKAFVSLADGSLHSLPEAFENQAAMNLFYFYDPAGDYNTIASPGANIDETIVAGTYAFANWTVRNTVRFTQLQLTQQQFDATDNALDIIATYDEAQGKRKAKNLAAGNSFSFKDEANGKYGLIYIHSVEGTVSGSVSCSIVVME